MKNLIMTTGNVHRYAMSACVRRVLLLIVIGACLLAQRSEAQCQPPPVDQRSKHYSTSETSVGVLLDDPAARAIVSKYIPEFSTSKRMQVVRRTTLKSLQRFSPEKITDDVLKKIDTELAALPAK